MNSHSTRSVVAPILALEVGALVSHFWAGVPPARLGSVRAFALASVAFAVAFAPPFAAMLPMLGAWWC